ncbi:MAG: elongation factor P--(R)-beta-lysine ligase [Steroidobacteraceae bacterium]
MSENPTNSWRPTASFTTLQKRARMLRAVRDYFAVTRALEVETPTLSAAAVSDIHLASVQTQVCGKPAYLHTSPEYAMKRLLAAGSGDIFQIARVYRDGESGRYHNPEFTMIEWYRLGYDHHQLMDDVEHLMGNLLPARCMDRSERISYQDAMQLYAQVDALNDPASLLLAALQQAGIDVPLDIHQDRDGLLDLIMAVMVGPQLGRQRLTFVYDYPASQAALARIRGPVASRFELYLDGLELANGFHELGNASEQRTRFSLDLQQRTQRGLSIAPIDENFLAALAHELPDCAGVAVGFDRVMMCAISATHIDEVLAFPHERA